MLLSGGVSACNVHKMMLSTDKAEKSRQLDVVEGDRAFKSKIDPERFFFDIYFPAGLFFISTRYILGTYEILIGLEHVFKVDIDTSVFYFQSELAT